MVGVTPKLSNHMNPMEARCRSLSSPTKMPSIKRMSAWKSYVALAPVLRFVPIPEKSKSALAITPDGRMALAVKAAVDKVAVLDIDGGKATYDKKNDLPANNYPYKLAVAPDGKLALIANTGNGGSSDGNVDTVSVIDLEADPVRVIDHVTVGDSPEGLAISPQGNIAVTIEARGSNRPPSTW